MSRSRDQAAGSRSVGVGCGNEPHSRRGALTWLLPIFCSLVAGPLGTARGQEASSPGDQGRSQPESTASKASGALPSEADAAALRAETLERLKAYEPTATSEAAITASSPRPGAGTAAPAAPAANASGAATVLSPSSDPTSKKSLPALLHDRLRWLNEYDAASLALETALHPHPTPEQQAADARGEIARLRNILAQGAQSPESLLPPLFRGKPVKVATAVSSEMKEAIEAASNDLKEWKTKLETLRGEMAKWNSLMDARRGERDSLFQRVTALGAKSGEYQSAVTDAQTAAERRLAHERLVNFEWEVRVESLRLRVIEAELALEVKLAEVRELKAEVFRAHVQIAARTLEPMQAIYGLVAENQERDLASAKASEENKARLADDPLERFRARRTAEMLALEALVIKSEQTLVMSPSPSYEEQKTLADRADFDFANIKELLEDGKVSRLDAIRLNNEFRRIGPERDRLLRNEMVKVEAQVQFYENTLTEVELELLQNSLHDRFEHDLLRERLAPARWAEGEALIKELEREHRSKLLRRQRALEKLSEAASHTLVQITRRLDILDQEYGFIRTTIFWVRDQEPIGLETLTQGAREFNVLVKGLVRLVQETGTPKLWGQPSGEFVVTAGAVLIFPIALVRLRRVLGERIKRDLPPPHG